MSEVDRFIDELIELSESKPNPEALKLGAQRCVMAFIGRVVTRGDRWAPADEIISVLHEARVRIEKTPASASRIDLLTELDRAISAAAASKVSRASDLPEDPC